MREAAVAASRARAMGYEGLRSEQLQIVQSFVTGHDVFGVLPTGSACYIRYYRTFSLSGGGRGHGAFSGGGKEEEGHGSMTRPLTNTGNDPQGCQGMYFSNN